LKLALLNNSSPFFKYGPIFAASSSSFCFAAARSSSALASAALRFSSSCAFCLSNRSFLSANASDAVLLHAVFFPATPAQQAWIG